MSIAYHIPNLEAEVMGPNSSASGNPGTPKARKTPVGAIAGGVIGGVVALALIGLAIFLIRRKRKLEQQPSNVYVPPPPSYTTGAGFSHPGHTSIVTEKLYVSYSHLSVQQFFC